MDVAELEGLAATVIDDWGKGPSVDLFTLATDLGFEIRADARAAVAGNVIYVDHSLRHEKQRWDAGHELSHVLLRDARIDDTEQAVQYLTSCLLLPRLDFLRDVRQLGRNPFLLKARYPHASHEAIARRLVACGESVLWVWDRAPEENRYKVVTPGWRWARREPTPLERDAMLDALTVPGEPVEPIGGVVAWAVLDGPWIRMLCLSDAEVLLGTLGRASNH